MIDDKTPQTSVHQRFFSLMMLLLLVFSGCISTEQQHNTANYPPLLHIQPAIYQLGDIAEGQSAEATFLIRNNHAQAIEITDIQASCGCTITQLDSYFIPAYGVSQLKVTVNTTAKQHGIKKTIHIRNSLADEAMATLIFNVVAPPHGAVTGNIKGIFDAQCATCHYEPALHKTTGFEIYQAACVMCHGEQGQGAYAPNLQGYSSFEALSKVIHHGVGKPQMPAFAQALGGPLTPSQIETLAHWLMLQ